MRKPQIGQLTKIQRDAALFESEINSLLLMTLEYLLLNTIGCVKSVKCCQELPPPFPLPFIMSLILYLVDRLQFYKTTVHYDYRSRWHNPPYLFHLHKCILFLNCRLHPYFFQFLLQFLCCCLCLYLKVCNYIFIL